MIFDNDEAVTWVYVTDVDSGAQHMIEFDGEYDGASDDEIADLVLRDYSHQWPRKEDFLIDQVELGSPDQ